MVLFLKLDLKSFMSLRILENLKSLLLLLMWRFSQSLVAAVVVCIMAVVVEQEDCYIHPVNL